MFQAYHDTEAARALGRKTQSPSTLGWRLRLEVRKTWRVDKTIELEQAISPHGTVAATEGHLSCIRQPSPFRENATHWSHVSHSLRLP